MDKFEQAQREGRTVVRNGVEYEVIGRYDRPCYILQRAGCEVPIEEHTRLSVIPGSPWADEWRLSK